MMDDTTTRRCCRRIGCFTPSLCLKSGNLRTQQAAEFAVTSVSKAPAVIASDCDNGAARRHLAVDRISCRRAETNTYSSSCSP